jgi:hypothetical protein
MLSKFPWTFSMCTGAATQFLITDADGAIVMLGEVYSEEDLLALLTLFQRNQEIRVDLKSFKDWRWRSAVEKLMSESTHDPAQISEIAVKLRESIEGKRDEV